MKSAMDGNYNQFHHVLVIEDEDSRKTVILEGANYSVGRDSRNTIVLNSQKVSRLHATLLRRTNTINRSFSYWLLDGDLQTGLPSRPLLMEQSKMAIASSIRSDDLLSLVFLELEIFEENGNSLNYRLKSRILEGFAKRLRACLRLGDSIAYWESSQFGCILPQVRSTQDVGRVCNRMLESLKQQFFLDNKKVYTRISIGIALKGNEEKTAGTMIHEAQDALAKSQESGSNNYKFANEKLQLETERLLRIEKLLAHALERKEFCLCYQPQIAVNENKITGIEALIRWEHRDLGIVSPGEFISLAVETGLIVPMGEWVLETACQ